MSELVTVAINAAIANPTEFLMGPMILPVVLLLTFTLGAILWKVAGLIEAKFNK